MPGEEDVGRTRVATVWLDGCSGCHMSFLDIDERLLDVAERIDLVHGPLVDVKEFPEGVDVTLVEGAVSSSEDEHKLKVIRGRTKVLVALGDCAVNSNVPSMRNAFRRVDILQRAYVDNAAAGDGAPSSGVPELRIHATPLHEVVKVDAFLPGCPPDADRIFRSLCELLGAGVEGSAPAPRFG